MGRWFLGSFDHRAGNDASGLVAAARGHGAEIHRGQLLQVAHALPAAGSGSPLCLFDGRLDNAAEIAAELGNRPAAGDGEALLAAAYRRWGSELPARLRGEFALLIWDEERRRGLIARDQLGARPLFIHRAGSTLRFGLEIGDLLATLPLRPAPDPVALAHWIAAVSQPPVRTLYQGVHRLGPGEMILLDRHGARTSRYWRPRFQPPLTESSAEVAERLRGGLERSVARARDGSRPVGILMSGGLDSSTLAALAATESLGQTRAYAGAFPDHPAVDESELIAELRREIGLPGATASVRPGGMIAAALAYISRWQLPLLGWNDFWMAPLLGTAAAQGVETVLDGTGGDELFGPFSCLIADRLRAGRPGAARELAHRLPGAGAHVGRREIAGALLALGAGAAMPYRAHTLGRRLRRSGAPTWLRRRAARELSQSFDPFAWKRLDGPRWWAYTAHAVAYEIEAAGVFEYQRHLGAAAGLEIRRPLLDLDLIELALRQPPAATFDPRFSRPLLRAAMAGALPESVRLRAAKAWFDPLIVDCLAGADGAAVRELLNDPGAEVGAHADLGVIRRDLLDSDRLRRSQPLTWMSSVWRLVTAELWLRSQHASSTTFSLHSSVSERRVEIATIEPTPTFFHLDRR